MHKCNSSWSQKDLSCALKEIRSGSMKIATASRNYKIPRRTLRDYISKEIDTKKKRGRDFTLSKEQREELNSQILRLAEIGYPITITTLRLSVYKYCIDKKLNHHFSDEKQMASYKWAKQYLKLNPSISFSIRKSQNLNPARAQKLNKTVVIEHFQRYKNILQKHSLNGKPEKIWNMDEKGCRLTMHKSKPVLDETETKVDSEHSENITAVSCANACGTYIPPMIIYKGKNQKKEWGDDFPPGSIVKMSEKGCMTQSLFIEWLDHFAKYKGPGTCILIFDGAKSHLSCDIVEAAEKFDIVLYCIPSNTTHVLQPLNKSVFRTFEINWDEELAKYWFNNNDSIVKKQKFSKIFTSAWQRSMSTSNIESGFRATGLYPYNPLAIPEDAYKPTLPESISPTISQVGPSTTGSVRNAKSALKCDSQPEAGPSTPHNIFNTRVDDLEIFEQSSLSEDEVTFHAVLFSS